MLSMILSIVILNMETPLPTTGPWMLLIGGFFLMVVNAFSLTALWNRNWLWLAFAEGAYAFLTVVIYASAIVAVCLALELESPVAEAISKGWDRGTAVKMEMHKLWCADHAGTVCETFYANINAALDDPVVDSAACPFTRVQIAANCSLVDPINEPVQAEACAPASSHTQAALHTGCMDCNDVCRAKFIEDIEDDLYPVSIVAYIMCITVFVTACWNSFVVLEHATRKDEEGKTVARAITGIWKGISFGLNGFTFFLGIVLLGTGIILSNEAKDDCKNNSGAAADMECSNSKAFLALMLLGNCIAICAVVSTVGVWQAAQRNANFIWVNLLRISQLVYTVLGFLLLASAIVFSLSSGALESVNSMYVENFSAVRAHLDNVQPEYCRYAEGEPLDGIELGERSWRSQCEDRIVCQNEDTAGNIRNCAWDEEMFEAIHTSNSPLDACSTEDKPVKDTASGCKYLANMMSPTRVPAQDISRMFGDAADDSRQQVAQETCAKAVRDSFDMYAQCPYEQDPINGMQLDLFDCSSCFPNQEFAGTGDTALCRDNDLEIEIMFQSTSMSCTVVQATGLCHFPVEAFSTFLSGAAEGERKLSEICECACIGDNGNPDDNGNANSTCVDVPPSTGAGPLDDLADADTNLAATAIRLGTQGGISGDVYASGATCELLSGTSAFDRNIRCGKSLRVRAAEETGIVLPAGVSEASKDLKVAEWCRETCCGFSVQDDASCGECGLSAISRNTTNALDAETLCFQKVMAYVGSASNCQAAVRANYAGNGGKDVRKAICRMTDYDCRNRIKYDAAQNMTVLAIVSLVSNTFNLA